LEDRTVPAGNVRAAVLGGTLFVTGDDAANQVWIAGAGAHSASVHAQGDTLLNEQKTPLLVGGFSNIVVRMNGGDDVLTVTGLRTPNFSADLGAGNDTFILEDAAEQKSIFIQGGSGNDTIDILDSQFPHGLAVNTGSGNDQLNTGNIGVTDFWMSNPSGVAFFNDQGSTITRPHFIGSFQVGVRPTNAPSVVLGSASSDPTNANPINFSAAFLAPVSGFNASGIQVTNGTVTSFTQLDAQTYAFQVTPTNQGVVTATVAAGAATDANGNANTASNTVSLTFDSIAPSAVFKPQTVNTNMPVLSGPVDDPTATVTATVHGHTYTAAVNGGVWAASVTDPLPDGTYSVTATATDKAGNTRSNTATNGLIVDATAPTVSFSADTGQFTNASTITVTLTFSEPVTEVSAGSLANSISLGNGSKGTVTIVDSKHATVVVTPTVDGIVTVNLAANAVKDGAGNPNAAASFEITYDTKPPTGTINPTGTGTISGTAADVNNGSGVASVAVSIMNSAGMFYSGPNTGFDQAQETFLPAAPIATGDFSQWFFTLPISGTYTVRAEITDKAGNQAIISQSNVVFTADTTPPTATISSMATSPTNLSSIPINVNFDEDVIGFTASDLTGAVTNGTASNFQQVDPSHYTFTITPTADGPVTFTLAAGAVTDRSGNPVAQTTFSITSDRTAPAKPTLDLTAASDSGAIGDLRTDHSTVDLTGSAEAGSTVTLTTTTVPGTPGTGSVIATVTAGGGGTFTFTNVPLSVGPNSFVVQVKDAAGNTSPTFAQTFTLNQPPVVANAIADQTATAGGSNLTFDLTNTFTDAEQVVQLAVAYPGGHTGNIDVNLFGTQAPNTVANFLSYVNGASAANYDNSVFHRLESGFVLQGGGFKFNAGGTTTATKFPPITASPPVANEPGIANTLGTIAMAKLNDPNSATDEFFFNLGDNSTTLDSSTNAGGFTVFGQVMNGGQEVINSIAANTTSFSGSGIPGAPPFPVSKTADTTNFPANITTADVARVTTARALTAAERMVFSVDSPAPTVATASITNGTLTITPKGAGTVTFTISATDLDGSTTTTTVKVTVS
jgi:cyclophilin family peptidyl-prolyl cis-trans isomerase